MGKAESVVSGFRLWVKLNQSIRFQAMGKAESVVSGFRYG